MPKRYTATEKWGDCWFSGLSPDSKLVMFYLWDNCDVAGVCEVNFRDANFRIGKEIDWKAAYDEINRTENEFGQKFLPQIVALDSSKWWLTKFIAFQQGKNLSERHAPHVPIIRSLRKHGLVPTFLELYPGTEIAEGPTRLPTKLPHPTETVWSTKERIKEIDERITALRDDTYYCKQTHKSLIKAESLEEMQKLKKKRDALKAKLRDEDASNSAT